MAEKGKPQNRPKSIGFGRRFAAETQIFVRELKFLELVLFIFAYTTRCIRILCIHVCVSVSIMDFNFIELNLTSR